MRREPRCHERWAGGVAAFVLAAVVLVGAVSFAESSTSPLWAASTYSNSQLYWQRTAEHVTPHHAFDVHILWNKAANPPRLSGCGTHASMTIQGRRHGRTVWAMTGIGVSMDWTRHWTKRRVHKIAPWYRFDRSFNVRVHVHDHGHDCEFWTWGRRA